MTARADQRCIGIGIHDLTTHGMEVILLRVLMTASAQSEFIGYGEHADVVVAVRRVAGLALLYGRMLVLGFPRDLLVATTARTLSVAGQQGGYGSGV